MEQEVLLSICIPTYNRAGSLSKAIESIINQDGFDNRVEIVISDNCSSDNTKQVVSDFQVNYSNIIYHRNDKNLVDRNFLIVLSKGKGFFLKLLNDTACLTPGSLGVMLQIIQQNMSDKPVLYFSNGTNKLRSSVIKINSLNEFIREASFYITWILTFGIWRSHFESIPNKEEGIEINFLQTVLLLKATRMTDSILIITKELFSLEDTRNKAGYNLIKVFIGNYIGKIIFPLYKEGELSRRVYIGEKTRLLRFQIFPWLLRLKRCDAVHKLETKGARILFLKYFWSNPFYYFGYLSLYMKLVLIRIRTIFRRIFTW